MRNQLYLNIGIDSQYTDGARLSSPSGTCGGWGHALQCAGPNDREVTMIAVGEKAPGFTLQDQFARNISLDHFTGRRHVMLLFYPLDFTPT
jgi:hypothetical protein